MKTRPVAPYVLAVIGSLVLIVIAYAFFFTPKLNDTAALDKQLAETTTTNDELQVLADALAKKVSSISEEKSKVDEFNKAFPDEASQQDLIASILDAASSTGVTVTGINPAAPTAAPGAAAAPGKDQAAAPAAPADPAAAAAQASKVFAVVPLTINASGDQAALVVFMQRLEGLTRPFTAIEVTLVRGDSGALLTLTGQSFIAAPLQAPQEAKGEQAGKAPEEKSEAPAPAAATPAPESPAPSATPSAPSEPSAESAAATAPATAPPGKK